MTTALTMAIAAILAFAYGCVGTAKGHQIDRIIWRCFLMGAAIGSIAQLLGG